ncbi:laccase domain protein [Jannaschia pagri]|uniref:Purine nucleoside phosphorylase n=1 Tax=Jannaschia pagri TaxID=2829797 RepID=A0ABQ4NLH2_9RHOB|nr:MULTISPECIES: peptidoglycan editing factor PgeF [unclassified Jannaschia]GIT91115.1 laccase domain protein [Jannaschia sp. AI_61]GIT94947.1 laccase domain protein [Jannaschia sp. AI_62]
MTLEILRSNMLGDVAHGFFTRKGGASSGIFAGLNCGVGSSDQAEAVATNRARVAEAMGGPLRAVHQVHSATAIAVDGPLPDPRPQADAMVSAQPGEVLTILTADCQPVLFHDPVNRVIGAAHAGWKGALGGVLEATVDEMEARGADRSQIRAAIGPSISQRAYEVGPEFLDTFMAKDPEARDHFAQGANGRYQFDLIGYGLRRLRGAGVQAEWTGHCTYSDPARFYSYRRTTHAGEADYGRLIAAIRL